MPDCTPEELAKRIQMESENIHCASAVFAAEIMLTERFKDYRAVKIGNLRERMETALLEGDHAAAERLAVESAVIKASFERNSPRIRILYENLSEGTARHTMADDIITIILPRAHQDVIMSEIHKDEERWTDEMKKARNILRELTLHELGHIVSGAFVEDAADRFSKELFQLREKRNNGIYNHKKSSSETCGNC